MAESSGKRAPRRQAGNGGGAAKLAEARSYVHADKDMAARPEIGAAPRFNAKKPPTTYRYDSSLSPALDFDTNPVRETGAFLLDCIEAAARLPPPHLFPERRVLRGADGKPLIEVAGLQDALARLRAMQKPFLDWTGKAERQEFEVPTLPLFVHERLSTAAIVKTLESHRRQPAQGELLGLFADPHRPMAEQVRAFEHRDRWVNRMILGDSLVVMNSLLRFEGLGGQVQCIYIDPPYGVKFGSNFQPFVRKRDVSHGDDSDMTREPEMVQAYRDTWELGLHSYLTYLRDRLMVARDLLTPSGSVFVQISDDNLHHVRELMDEVFGAENFVSQIAFHKTTSASADLLPTVTDHLLFYARNIERIKYRDIFLPRLGEGWVNYDYVRLADGTHRRMTIEERADWSTLPAGASVYRRDNLTSPRPPGDFPVEIDGRKIRPVRGYWKTGEAGMQRLKEAHRLEVYGNTLSYRRFASDFPFQPMTNAWADTVSGGYVEQRLYAVQTTTKVVQRCILMTTDPGDLVLDPTCGSGTTAYVAEQWGRRWITIDTSRVPLALARQRLLTATYPWYRLRDDAAGPGAGFVYARRQNRKGEEVGGIVPHVTLKSIASDEPPAEEVLVDRPEEDQNITRVAGPFVVEATLPTANSVEGEPDGTAPPPQPSPARGEGAEAPSPRGRGLAEGALGQDTPGDHIQRMIEVLRKSPALALPGNRKVRLANIRRPARTVALSAEARMEDVGQAAAPSPGAFGATLSRSAGEGFARGAAPTTLSRAAGEGGERSEPGEGAASIQVAILFGPADGPVTAKSVLDAAKEANVKGFRHLFVIGFAITADARAEIDGGEAALGLPATYVTATMDLQMGDLLKTSRASQIFAVCGMPEISVTRLAEAAEDGTPRWQVRLLGLDVFDPVTMTTDHRKGDDVPCWMLDTSWNGLAFHADQVFFPRTGAWDNLRKALKATHDEAVWDFLKGDTSAPFAAPAGQDVAVKVIDDRGNELAVHRKLGQ